MQSWWVGYIINRSSLGKQNLQKEPVLLEDHASNLALWRIYCGRLVTVTQLSLWIYCLRLDPVTQHSRWIYSWGFKSIYKHSWFMYFWRLTPLTQHTQRISCGRLIPIREHSLLMYFETLSSNPGLMEHALWGSHACNPTFMPELLWAHGCALELTVNALWEANPCIPPLMVH